MTRSQRVALFLSLITLAVVVLVAFSASSDDSSDPAPSASASAEPTPSATPEDDEREVSATPPELLGGAGQVGVFALEQEAQGHSYTTAQAVEVAEQFDLVTALRGSFAPHVDAMREANPDLVLSVYLNAAFAQVNQSGSFPSDWYLRDADGERVRNDFDLWMMDVGNPGWLQNRVETCQAFLQESGYDGCFLDNLGSGTLWPPSLTGLPIDPRTGEEYADDDWVAATEAISAAVRDAIGPDRHVIANGLVSGSKYFDDLGPTSVLLDDADFGLAETFVRPSGLPVDEARPETAWRQDVDMLVDAAMNGRRVMAVTKVWVDGAPQEDIDRWHEFALASFLLGDNGQHWFAFTGDRAESPLVPHPWWAQVDLGEPVDTYERTDDGIYRREFADGLVLANPTDVTRTVELDEAYVTLSGDEVTSVELPPRAGAVLAASDG